MFQVTKTMTRKLTQEERDAIADYWEANPELTVGAVADYWEKKLGTPVTMTCVSNCTFARIIGR